MKIPSSESIKPLEGLNSRFVGVEDPSKPEKKKTIKNDIDPADKAKLISVPKYENALKSTGLTDDYRYYFAVREADSADGTVIAPGVFYKDGKKDEISKWGDSKKTPRIALDIPPTAISITSPFAISVIATNKGILEEHNGLVFKTIVISGTTGVLPIKKQAKQRKEPILSNYFPEAGKAIDNLVGSFKKLSKYVGGDKGAGKPEDQLAQLSYRNTGYAKFWRLHNFLVAYAEAKKDVNNKNARLVFGSTKDNIEYVCTPIQFDMKRDASKPLLYNYTIVLKCWEVTQPTVVTAKKIDLPSPKNPGAIKDILNTVTKARNTIQAGKSVLQGVNNDIQSVLDIGGQAIYFMKDTVGLVGDVLDFPLYVINNADKTIVGAWEELFGENGAAAQAFQSGDDRIKRVLGGTDIFALSSSEAATESASSTGESTDVSPDGQTPDTKIANSSPNSLAAKQFLKYALENPDIGSQISIDSIAYPDDVKQELDALKEQAKSIDSGDIRELQKDLQSTSDNLAQSVGMMEEQYAKTYGLPAPAIGRTPTEDDIILMAALQEQKDGFGSLLATGELLKEASPDPFIAANTNLPEGDRIETPASSFVTRLNDGENLQTIALRTLGDAEKWREIAIVNDLKPPYITTQPLSKPFTAPSGRTVLVSDASDLAIGLSVNIVGSVTTRRKILNIENLDSSYRITFDGPDNLSSFVSSSVKKLTYAQPGTVLSGDPILVPSQGVAEDFVTLRPTPLYSKLSHAEKTFKIDLAVNDKGDFVIAGDGDIARSYGYDNAVQAIKLALTIEKGELERHPSYGLEAPIGSRGSDLSIDEIDAAVSNQIVSDSRFTDAQTRVTIEGSENPVVRIEIVASGAEGTGLIPIEFRSGEPD